MVKANSALVLPFAFDLLFERRAHWKFVEGRVRQLVESCLPQAHESQREEFAYPAPELHGFILSGSI
jgi:hypothetical protein